MITKNSVVKIQMLVVNHESPPVKSNTDYFSVISPRNGMSNLYNQITTIYATVSKLTVGFLMISGGTEVNQFA